MLPTSLDKKWDALMALCDQERELAREGNHPKLARLLAKEIEQLARELEFTAEDIQLRRFRAVKKGRHIVKLIAGGSPFASLTD